LKEPGQRNGPRGRQSAEADRSGKGRKSQARGNPAAVTSLVVIVVFVLSLVERRLEGIGIEVELLLRLLQIVDGPPDAHFRADLLALEIGETAVTTGRSHVR